MALPTTVEGVPVSVRVSVRVFSRTINASVRWRTGALAQRLHASILQRLWQCGGLPPPDGRPCCGFKAPGQQGNVTGVKPSLLPKLCPNDPLAVNAAQQLP